MVANCMMTLLLMACLHRVPAMVLLLSSNYHTNYIIWLFVKDLNRKSACIDVNLLWYVRNSDRKTWSILTIPILSAQTNELFLHVELDELQLLQQLSGKCLRMYMQHRYLRIHCKES